MLLESGAEDGIAASVLAAASNGHVDVIQLLLDNCGKDADIIKATGIDALFEAIKGDHEAVVRFLVSRCVDPNSTGCFRLSKLGCYHNILYIQILVMAILL